MASPSLLNIDTKRWTGLTPTLNNSQHMKGEGQKECLGQTLPDCKTKNHLPHHRMYFESGPLLMRLSVPRPLLAPSEGGYGLKHAVQLSSSPKSTAPVSFWHFSSLEPKRFAHTAQQLHSARAQAAAQHWLPVCCELASNSS